MNQKEFIAFISPYAIRATSGTKIFPAVAIARAIIESGDGKGNYGDSPLNKANNYFGITAGENYTGKKVLVKTWEGVPIRIYGDEKFISKTGDKYVYLRNFRAYDTPEQSFKDFVDLVSSGRYKDSLTATTPEQQASIIAKAGYATAPNAESLFVSVTGKVKSALEKLKDIVVENKGNIEKAGLVLGVLGIIVSLNYGRK